MHNFNLLSYIAQRCTVYTLGQCFYSVCPRLNTRQSCSILMNVLDELNGSSYVNECLESDTYSMATFAHIKVFGVIALLLD